MSEIRTELAFQATQDLFWQLEEAAKEAQSQGRNLAYSPCISHRQGKEFQVLLTLEVQYKTLDVGEWAPAGWTFVDLQSDPKKVLG